MHPYTISTYVESRHRELVEQATAHRAVAELRKPRATTRLRLRAGWWLVALGLKLATERTARDLRSATGAA